MKTAITLRQATTCGGCGARLAVGDDAVALSNGRGWRLVRCVACAGPVAHATTGARVASEPPFAARVAELAAKWRAGRDWKRAQGGE